VQYCPEINPEKSQRKPDFDCHSFVFEKKPSTFKKSQTFKIWLQKAKLANLRQTRMNNRAIARRSGDVFFSVPVGWLYHVIAASDFVLALA